ncbi:MerR family transcriptional regulator [Paenibacillus sp. YPG26]|uniref:MerR family transcriptional regulator n=1 Tax=Paenibacillus sp. YPG26 TaxID=2878915 RepID=UPI00203B498D|nr:MerR family transcriptional regulator [Paenibacillus sp. YPG26]USB34396.1 MerR family transcriptional regulator [Paenibacillus sp. YPG26]
MMKESIDPMLDLALLKKLVIGIGEVSDITGVPQRQIRYWEEKGVIHSVKEGEGSTRKYDYMSIKKIILVKELLDDGFTLDAAAKRVEERIKTIDEVFQALGERIEMNKDKKSD